MSLLRFVIHYFQPMFQFRARPYMGVQRSLPFVVLIIDYFVRDRIVSVHTVQYALGEYTFGLSYAFFPRERKSNSTQKTYADDDYNNNNTYYYNARAT